MSSVTTPLFKPLAMAASLHSLFTPKASYPFCSLPSNPLSKSLHLSHSSPWWISVRNKSSPSNLITFIASTSEWPQQEEEGEAAEVNETQALVSDWEGDGLEGGGEVDGVEEEEETGGDEYVDPPEDAKLFVGNLPYDVTSEMLAELFEKAGTVEICEVIYDRETDRSRGFGFVWMKTVEEALKGVELFSGYDLNGRYLTVNKAAPRGSRPERTPRTFEPSFRIYVGNLPWQVDDARLEQVFSEHGKVVEARVVYDRETGRSRGFGFVSMSTQSELNDAIEALDGQSLEGRSLRVNVAEERPRRNSF